MIRQRLMTFANSIKTRKEDGLDVSAQTTFMEQGQQAMVLIRRLVAQMTTEERARLKERQAIQDRNTEGTAGFAVLVSLVALALFATLFVLFARANRRRHRAEELLHQTNLELEQRVQERLEQPRAT